MTGRLGVIQPAPSSIRNKFEWPRLLSRSADPVGQIGRNFAPVGEQSPTSSPTTPAKTGGSRARVTEISVITVSDNGVPCLTFGSRNASFLLEVPLGVAASLPDEGHSGGLAVDSGVVIEERLNLVIHAC